MPPTLPRQLPAAFEALFGRPPAVAARAPGRVNIIGEHIDYQGGTVLPMAISRSVWALAAPSGSSRCRLASLESTTAGRIVHADLARDWDGQRPADPLDAWAAYPLGVAREIARLGSTLPGFDLLVHGDVPLGSGLSSSAAIEVATALALAELAGLRLAPEQIALLAQRAERDYVGVPCGVMDQAASACAREGRALRIDCAAPELVCEQVELPAGATFVVAHCGVPRGLSGSAYETRQIECRAALDAMNAWSAAAAGSARPHLCAYAPAEFEAFARARPDLGIPLLRARFAVEENARVAQFCAASAAGDLAAAGRLMNESHFGLRNLYEVSTPELDDLTDLARRQKGVYGARLTGAGFGGCAIALTEPAAAGALIAALRRDYYAPRGFEPLAFESPAEAGAALVPLDAEPR